MRVDRGASQPIGLDCDTSLLEDFTAHPVTRVLV
jgi:hypothetical protein